MTIMAEKGLAPACPVCGSVDVALLCSVDGYDIFRCGQSETEFVWPMPDSQSLKSLYDDQDWFEGGQKGGYQSYDNQTQGLLTEFHELLTAWERTGTGRSILDIGCAYGTHLMAAHERGWKCFGVETSEHARKVAGERYGNKLFIVDCVEKLIPHEFDVILMLDVLEHLTNPFEMFFALFNIGAITPKTKIIITTPNAGSDDARRNPADWAFRHPPSHLVYYSEPSLRVLLTKLHFTHIDVTGMYPLSAHAGDAADAVWAGYAGLYCQAWGSDFLAFMHERYVPGTWSRIAAYEHLPRYHFANTFAKGKRVLDFGCGTGYGSALLAESASQVLGVDISEAALAWARQTHHAAGLRFEQRADLCREIPARTYDLITCFEMIEHVDEATQRNVLDNFSKILTPEGMLFISTPNPAITANYGPNPFHHREMTEREFESLLKTYFQHVYMIRQWLGTGVLLSPQLHEADFSAAVLGVDGLTAAPPLAYIAVCSNVPLPAMNARCSLDFTYDYIAETLAGIKEKNLLKFSCYTAAEQLAEKDRLMAEQASRLEAQSVLYTQQSAKLLEQEQLIQSLLCSKSWQMTKPLRELFRLLK